MEFSSVSKAILNKSTPSPVFTVQNKETQKRGLIKIHIPSYFQPWITISYYLLLIPFKINQNGSAYYVHRNKFQRVRKYKSYDNSFHCTTIQSC